MFKILIIILIGYALYTWYKKRMIKENARNSKLGIQNFSGVMNEPEWWEFGKKSARKEQLKKSKHIFMNTLHKQQGKR